MPANTTIVCRIGSMPGSVWLTKGARALFVASALGDRFHDIVEIEAARFLPRWKFAEALQPPADIGACRSENEHMIYPPLCITNGFIVGPLERIEPRVYDLTFDVTLATQWQFDSRDSRNYDLSDTPIVVPVIFQGTYSTVKDDCR